MITTVRIRTHKYIKQPLYTSAQKDIFRYLCKIVKVYSCTHTHNNSSNNSNNNSNGSLAAYTTIKQQLQRKQKRRQQQQPQQELSSIGNHRHFDLPL